MAKLTAEQRIEKCHVSLMRNPKFGLFSGLFMVGKVSVDDTDEIPTAKTNGIDVIYGRDFVNMLNDKQLAFLILHENMHKAYRHLFVWQNLYKLDPDLANMACDYVINLQLHNYDEHGEFIEIPTDPLGNIIGCIDKRFEGMDSMQVFNILREENGGGSGGSGRGNDGQTLDEHDWEGAKGIPEQEQEVNAREVESALRQGAKLAGKLGNNVPRDIQELLEHKIDWKEALRDFVKNSVNGQGQSTWRRLHKRYIGMDIVMPSSYDEVVGDICIAVDTSGSIGGKELAQFLGEVKSICEEVCPEKIELLYWDAKVVAHEVYMQNELATLVDTTKPKGGGGTDPTCIPVYMKDKRMEPQCLIILTDGYIGRQNPSDWFMSFPIMWCIKGNPSFNEKVVGKVVHVE
jgi:predicted metal-dependent peptidase